MFRHAFASSVRSGGAPLDVVQALLGHQSIHSTLIYNNPRELHRTGEKLQVAC
jgi:site-specific recombinase XerD